MRDLDFPTFLDPIVLSEEVGVEKPSSEIFRRAIARVNTMTLPEISIRPEECLHVGDELKS